MPFRLGLWEIFLILPALLTYFVPTVVAVIRKAKNLGGIFLLNLLAGWTFLGWVASLVWAIVAEKTPK
ncbi:superinfection immunity protein [Chloroflexota bacterium]